MSNTKLFYSMFIWRNAHPVISCYVVNYTYTIISMNYFPKYDEISVILWRVAIYRMLIKRDGVDFFTYINYVLVVFAVLDVVDGLRLRQRFVVALPPVVLPQHRRRNSDHHSSHPRHLHRLRREWTRQMQVTSPIYTHLPMSEVWVMHFSHSIW